jgi:enamine deaminase RidA (YjgF/YER057c/UK114 family)
VRRRHCWKGRPASQNPILQQTSETARREDWEPCWPVFRKHFGKARPASTLIHAGLQTDIMRIEIEVTARLPKKG